MSSAAGKGREGGMLKGLTNAMAGVQGGGGDKGLAGQSGEEWKPAKDFKPEDNVPSPELVRQVGDVEKVTPRDPTGFAKQDMEQERGQHFTSATGEGITQRPGGNPVD